MKQALGRIRTKGPFKAEYMAYTDDAKGALKRYVTSEFNQYTALANQLADPGASMKKYATVHTKVVNDIMTELGEQWIKGGFLQSLFPPDIDDKGVENKESPSKMAYMVFSNIAMSVFEIFKKLIKKYGTDNSDLMIEALKNK